METPSTLIPINPMNPIIQIVPSTTAALNVTEDSNVFMKFCMYAYSLEIGYQIGILLGLFLIICIVSYYVYKWRKYGNAVHVRLPTWTADDLQSAGIKIKISEDETL